jgi:cysteine desulfurase
MEYLGKQGFEITLIKPHKDGEVSATDIASALRPDTLLVSVMQVNNETGIVQPIPEIANALGKHDAFFHVDAAQGFGKRIPDLQNPRIDLISISGHKIYAPKGIGALVVRHRGFDRIPLSPLFHGGGQERGLRPGTLPVALIVALGKAAELCVRDSARRLKYCQKLKEQALTAFQSVGGIPTGNQSKSVPSTLNIAVPGLDSEAVIVALKDLIAISNGSACTSQNYTASHVLQAMALPIEHIKGALRLSWCHLTADPPWDRIVNVIRSLH